MANGLRRSITVLFICLLGAEADSQETLMLVKEWPVAEGTHVVAVFDDGAAYHSLVPNDSSAPEACANPRRVSLSLLTSYDYAGLRRKGEPDFKLDPAEVERHWRTITERPVDYVAEAESTIHGNVWCAFAVVGKPIAQLTELRLMKYKSLFFDILPRAPDQRNAATWFWQATYDFARRVTTPSFQ